MTESKVVIKINYDKNSTSIPEPKTVTVWHIPRIAAALGLLALLLSLLIFFVTRSGNNNEPVHVNSNNDTQTNDITGPLYTQNNERKDINSAELSAKSLPEDNKKTGPDIVKIQRTSAIILDKDVIRASLNTTLKNNEPAEPASWPLRLAEQQSVKLLYFNQLRDIKNKRLFHYWLKDGKVVLKKKLDVIAGTSKVVSSKTMSAKDNGDWEIQLQDHNGKIYCKIEFVIEEE
ncbi:MAG: DUF2914 domain-containing protein [Methylomonas sp.]|jgi:hypothetical protein